ncbi:MAG: thiamine pyrophosphate-binding protein [Streptosporangiaceae bacterium]
MRGADAVVAALRAEGVSHVFGLPGTTIMDLLDAFARQREIRYISARHEQVAAFMADGFARATGDVGVCVASRGPGAANMATAIHNAHAESIPVLAVIGQVADQITYRDAFEEMDLLGFFRPITKWCAEVHRPERVPELVQRGVRVAVSGRPGPVVVSLPLDVQQAAVEAAPVQPRFRVERPAPAGSEVEAAAALLADARRPVMVVGGGLMGRAYSAEVVELAEELSAPVVTTWLRKGAFPNTHPLFLGSLGYGAPQVAEEAVREADVVLALGCRFAEFTTRRWTLLSADTAVVQVDIDAEEIGRHYTPRVGLHADAGTAAAALRGALDARPGETGRRDERRERARALRARYLSETELTTGLATGLATGGTSAPVSSADLVLALREMHGRRPAAVLVQDAPSFGTWIHRYLDFDWPGSFYGSAGGSMGWGFPAALGMQLARPDERVVTVSGDGSFWMVAQDLETSVREDIPVVNVIANNFSYGNTRDRQRYAHDGRYLGVFYRNPDFAELARLLGAHGERVEKAADLVPALDRALDSGLPAVVDVIQDAHEGLPPGLRPPKAR